MGQAQYIQLIIRLVLILINGILIFYGYSNGFLINTFGFILLLVIQVFLLLNYIKNQFSDIEKTIDCLLHDDYTANVIAKAKKKSSLHYKTALLTAKQQQYHLQNTSEQLIYTTILESLSFGVLILRKDQLNDIEIFQINTAFTDFIQIPKFKNWHLLKPKIGKLTTFIEDWKTIRHTITLKVNDESETFFLKTSITSMHNYEYLVLSLETIQQLINKKEKEAWYKLMNVMSHEIINTITPISSLAENLDTLLQEDTSTTTLDELSEGLQIIKRRSYDLTSFVDTYRRLAELPLPNKMETNLVTVVNKVINLCKQSFLQNNIQYTFITNKPYIVTIDAKQIEQVLINLITNSINAFKGINKPKVTITIKEDNRRIILDVMDNGCGIADTIKDNIFMPYFTTTKNGSGIGLTLSKSIMEAHNGKLLYISDNNLTKLSLIFIQ